ncbi:hypothetical protein PIB30_067988 [Stylosanthes scabra]|uniref:CCHC-type domain-containing protein n=1 Tax=Stylosanthes scabra TaxID=79078 RepID=A0ABU6QNI1_9FABA|nr:hypothetical protein [Stylosanthes scabra]
MAKKKNFNFKGKRKTPPKCFECGEVGHIIPNCPKLQKREKDKKMKKKKQKAYMSWENEDDSSTNSDEEEVANLSWPTLKRKIEERKLADQETEFGSKIEIGSTHMRG